MSSTAFSGMASYGKQQHIQNDKLLHENECSLKNVYEKLRDIYQ